ncbi:MAG: extracellular solute-binding protein [Myxococcales bacterium]
MRRSWLALGALVVVLALPFVARSRRSAAESSAARAAAETLVILTPHNEAVRFEFGRAFREHMARRGRRVEVDWRTPGGSAEISRYLNSEYMASFEQFWTRKLGHTWSARTASSFMRPQPEGVGVHVQVSASDGDEAAVARREFLASDVGCGMDLLFGGGSSEHIKHAEAGRLVDAGVVQSHPETFGTTGIPHQVGGQTYWDTEGRWVGTCLSSFGICFNGDVMRRLGVGRPSSWAALADPRLLGHLALADPTKSASIAKVFETIVQSQMQRTGVDEGWARAARLIRRIGGNSRYFTDSASKVPLDVGTGDAAAGMCIDYYGRFQSETTAALGHPERVGFVAPPGESATDPDPIGLLRGAPHRALAVAFMEFVLSEEGQRLWAFRRGTPGGPQRYTLRRLPILPRLYDPIFDAYRGDPDEHPYQQTQQVEYHREWTGPLVGTIAFVIRVMCVDTEVELRRAYAALVAAGFPPRATATFDDMSLIDYATVSGPVRAALNAPDPLEEARMARELGRHFRDLYGHVETLAGAGQ